jgi:hypothetical protein
MWGVAAICLLAAAAVSMTSSPLGRERLGLAAAPQEDMMPLLRPIAARVLPRTMSASAAAPPAWHAVRLQLLAPPARPALHWCGRYPV